MKPLTILYILPALDGGGIDKIIYDYSMKLIDDGCSIDFVVSSEQKGILEDTLLQRGCVIHHITQMSKNIQRHCRELQAVLFSKKYDIVHDNSSYRSYFNLKVAKKSGIKVRIAHAHSAKIPMGAIDTLKKIVFSFLTASVATDLFSCGIKAAQWTWGNKKSVYIMRNAINVDGFRFDEEKRKKIRKEMNLEGKIVIGNVARLSSQKNHKFLINTFAEVLCHCPNAVLMLVGRGELLSEINEQISELGIKDSVLMLGVRTDVCDLLNAMDVFVLPSLYEGLPVTLVEVQANGLTIIGSTEITTEIKLNDNVYYLPLSTGHKYWAQEIVEVDKTREDINKDSFPYDIDISALELKAKYLKMLGITEL